MELHLPSSDEDARASFSKLIADISTEFNSIAHDAMVVVVTPELTPENLLTCKEHPRILVIHLRTSEDIRRLCHLEQRAHKLTKALPACIIAPMIVALASPALLSLVSELLTCAVDWVMLPACITDIAYRVQRARRNQQVAKPSVHSSFLTMVPLSHLVIYEGRQMRFTATEYALLELFMDKIGTVIPLLSLVRHFESSQRSAALNNIRVVIYQLRLKLAQLTQSKVSLMSAHRQGYCLRHRHSHDAATRNDVRSRS